MIILWTSAISAKCLLFTISVFLLFFHILLDLFIMNSDEFQLAEC